MNTKELTALIKSFGGWWDEMDSEVARFPTPYQKTEFEKAYISKIKNQKSEKSS